MKCRSTESFATEDCIGDGKSKCEEVGIEGFPTIKRLGFFGIRDRCPPREFRH